MMTNLFQGQIQYFGKKGLDTVMHKGNERLQKVGEWHWSPAHLAQQKFRQKKKSVLYLCLGLKVGDGSWTHRTPIFPLLAILSDLDNSRTFFWQFYIIFVAKRGQVPPKYTPVYWTRFVCLPHMPVLFMLLCIYMQGVTVCSAGSLNLSYRSDYFQQLQGLCNYVTKQVRNTALRALVLI